MGLDRAVQWYTSGSPRREIRRIAYNDTPSHSVGGQTISQLSIVAVMRESLGMRNVTMKNADGYDGWSEAGPFDCIMIAV